MKITKGTFVKVYHQRKGCFVGVATKDFDTDKDEFYPIQLKDKVVTGESTVWVDGDNIPCRNILCKIEVMK